MTYTIPADIRRKMEAQAADEFWAALGTVIEVTEITGINQRGDSIDVSLAAPIQVMVIETNDEALRHWNDNCLDPYWDVALVEPCAQFEGLDCLWVFGPTHEYHDPNRCIECQKELTPFLEATRCTRCEHFHQMDLADERGY